MSTHRQLSRYQLVLNIITQGSIVLRLSIGRLIGGLGRRINATLVKGASRRRRQSTKLLSAISIF